MKATDDRVSNLWGLLSRSTQVPKHTARVEVYKTQGLSRILAIRRAGEQARSVFALFVDESATNTVASATKLNRPPGATTANGEAANVWTTGAPNSPALAQLDMSAIDEAGLIVLQSRRDLSGQRLDGPDTLRHLQPGGRQSHRGRTCCFGNVKSGNSHVATNRTGVGFVFGQSGSPGPNTASVRDAELTGLDVLGGLFGGGNPSCLLTDPTSSPYFVWNGDCQVRITAQIDFGGNLPAGGQEVRVADQ